MEWTCVVVGDGHGHGEKPGKREKPRYDHVVEGGKEPAKCM